MNWKGIVVGLGLALVAFFAWVQFSDRETSARVLPELVAPDTTDALETAELQSPTVVVGREPDAGAAVETPEQTPQPELTNVGDGVTRLHGFVYDENGTPLEGVAVYLRTDAGELIKYYSESDGAWALEATEPGERLVTAYKRNQETAEAVLTVGPELPSVRHDLVLRALQVVRVDVVLPDGSPALPALREAGINLWEWSLLPLATKTDPGLSYRRGNYSKNERRASGSFWGPGQAGSPQGEAETLGFLTLHDQAPLFVSLLGSDQVLGTQVVDAETTEVVFTVSPVDFARFEARVTARIVAAEDGTPLACKAVLNINPFMRGLTTSADDGQLDLGGLVPGFRFLVVQAEGRAEVVQKVEVLPGRTLELGEIKMFKPVSIRGRIVSSETPMPTAMLGWGRYDQDTNQIQWVRQRFDSSKADGSFELSGLEPGFWAIRVPGLEIQSPRPHDPRLVSATFIVDASLGSVEDVELELLASTRITLVTGKVERGTRWVVRARDARGVFAGSASVGLYAAESDLHLPPGNFELELSRAGEVIERRAVAVGTKALRIDWPLE